jgi:hypothetical protein
MNGKLYLITINNTYFLNSSDDDKQKGFKRSQDVFEKAGFIGLPWDGEETYPSIANIPTPYICDAHRVAQLVALEIPIATIDEIVVETTNRKNIMALAGGES